MRHHIRRFIPTLLLAAAFAKAGLAQGPTAPKAPVPVKVTVVISRYEGDKKVSSLPYTLSATANGGGGSLRMGSQIPVPTGTRQEGVPVTYSFQNVGTNIDCNVTSGDETRFSVNVSISDSSVMERRSTDGAPTLRNFTTNNSVLLRDGQSVQFTAAADKTTGEVVKVDVTLTVEK